MVPVVGDTVIFCRPEQLPEAAVALSCCPADRFTPLIVMERSPISDDEYRIRYEAYVEARDRRDAIVGGPLARQEALVNLAAVETANREVDTKAEALTPYRSWWRHQLFIRDLLGAVAPRLAVFLFEPASHELQLIEAVPISRIGDQRMPLLPEGLKCVHVLAGAGQEDEAGNRFPYASLGELTDVAWRACGRADPMPGTSVEVAPADPADVLAGLSRALKRGVPLRARNDDGPAPADPDEDAGGGVPPTEAVLIEVSADATKLLGVQYARQRRAKLVLYPEPDTTGVEAARAAVEARHDDREKTAPTEVKRLGLAALREYIFGDPTIAERIRKLEHTVSQLVPDRVVTAVGDLDLTVFTIGIPYNFVKKKANWANKAIGHVTGDPSLLILTELCRKEADSEVTFSLIFDPGYFQTSETQAVFAALQKRSSYPLVLSGMAGSNMALLHVGPSLPLDLLFFNTHGSDKAILLSDGPLPAFKILQRQALPTRPFVFNSSCLSWVGVGREFIRVGARGYAGTLWSVDAEVAANYAGIVFDRITRQGWPVSRAMRNTGVASSTERAYIYIGTSTARLAEAKSDRPDIEQHRMLAAAKALLESAAGSLARSGSRNSIPVVTEPENLFWRQAEKLLADYDRRWPEPTLDRVEASIPDLLVLSYMADRWPDEVRSRLHVQNDAEKMLAALTLDAKTRQEQLASILRFGARLLLNLGQVEPAIPEYERAMGAAEQIPSPELAGEIALELCDALRLRWQNEKALVLAAKADADFAAVSATHRARLGSLGRLAQISSALGQYHVALSRAREGFALATTLDDLTERAEFKGDEARVLLRLARYEEALTEARTFLDLSRRAHDEGRELSGYGVITQALIGKRDLAEAVKYAQKGLDMARALGHATSVGDFLMDFTTIKSKTNDHAGALACALEAAPIFASIGHVAKIAVALGRAEEAFNALDPSSASALAPLFDMLQTQLDAVNFGDRNLRRDITSSIVRRVRHVMAQAGPQAIRARLQALLQHGQAVAKRNPAGNSEQLVFIGRALGMFDLVASGQVHEARPIAEDLDRLSVGGFQLVKFVEQYAARP
jgi:tetratricopeptide (TPR) repeat protein